MLNSIDSSVAVIGERQVGKSSLLRAIASPYRITSDFTGDRSRRSSYQVNQQWGIKVELFRHWVMQLSP